MLDMTYVYASCTYSAYAYTYGTCRMYMPDAHLALIYKPWAHDGLEMAEACLCGDGSSLLAWRWLKLVCVEMAEA